MLQTASGSSFFPKFNNLFPVDPYTCIHGLANQTGGIITSSQALVFDYCLMYCFKRHGTLTLSMLSTTH